jgi:glycolate oxidase FAD binding subunit
MNTVAPCTPEELAETLGSAAGAAKTVTLGGAFTKDRMAGPVAHSDVTISTASMKRVLQYEPRDLTISVEAGLPFAELSRILAANAQMIPLDPPFLEKATVGGVIAANTSGPRRRLYGTARDLIIGVKFATLEGKLVQSGGMVVKNVAGLDMGKLMIGSFGTLAAIAVVNFKLMPAPSASRTLIASFDTLEQAIAARDAVLKSVLQPAAIDLLNPHAAARVHRKGYLLMVQAAGITAVLDRYSQAIDGAEQLEAEREAALWEMVREFTPHFLAEHEDGAVVRVSSRVTTLPEVMGALSVPVVARAGSGVCYGYFGDSDSAAHWAAEAARRGWKAVVEFAAPVRCPPEQQWPNPGPDFAMMKKVKEMFDPKHLLNRGRLYGRL